MLQQISAKVVWEMVFQEILVGPVQQDMSGSIAVSVIG